MEVKTIAVIGAGTMGRGIAYAAAFGGYNTVLEDVSRHVLEQGIAWIRQSFEEGVARGKVEASVRDRALSLISTANNVEDAIRDADLIIEAVPEELEMKLELFTIFDKFAKTGAISFDHGFHGRHRFAGPVRGLAFLQSRAENETHRTRPDAAYFR